MTDPLRIATPAPLRYPLTAMTRHELITAARITPFTC